jgi:hypothetical protein
MCQPARRPHFSLAIISVTVQTLDIGVLGYIGILYPKEHPPEVWHIPPGTPCILWILILFLFHVLEVIKIEEKGKHPNTWDNSIYIR